MDCYLCQHCKTLANFPLTGPCDESPTGEHEFITGEDIADQVRMLWDRKSEDLANIVR